MTKHIYIAQFRYGVAKLYKAEVQKETAKTYVLTGNGQDIIGTLFFGIRRLLKNDGRLRSFTSEHDATVYLLSMAEQRVERCRDKLSAAVRQADDLSARLQDE